MELKDEIRIDAPREAVFAALNDPEVLKQAIPGCEDLEKLSDTEFTATVVTRIGPIKARFKGAVTLSDLNPPESYTISGQGKGGTAGFARGGAKIHLSDDGGATLMRYEVTVDVGGKLAQLGGRLIEGVTKKLAGQFFGRLEEIIAAPSAGAEPAAVAEPPAEAPHAGGVTSPLVWIAAAAALVLAAIYFIVTRT